MSSVRHIQAMLGLLFLLLPAGAGVYAPDAAAHGTAVVPPPEECRVAPRSLAEVQELAASPAVATTSLPGDPGPFIMPPGQPVDDEAASQAVRATVWELLACTNAG